jgi:Protein of unknown function (DUF3311)
MGSGWEMAGDLEDRQAPQGAREPPPSLARHWYWLLLLPFLALLYPPLYSHLAPHLFGIPFFYWYQAVWLAITAAVTTFVYRRTR